MCWRATRRMRAWLWLLVLARCGAPASPPAGGRGAEGQCEPDDPCCINRVGDQTCDPNNASCFGRGARPGGDFAGCPTGRLYWKDWTSLDAGVFVQITRPLNSSVGPRRCAKVVITKASNVLGYISKHPGPPGSCGDREALTDNMFADGHAWFNVTGTNESLNLDFGLLDDVDWKGTTNLHITLRPNQDGNFSSNYSSFDFDILPCKMTGFETDKALWQTGLMDTLAASFAFVWVTASWTFCGGVRQSQSALDERRASSVYGLERSQVQEGLRPGRNSRKGLSEGLLAAGNSSSVPGTSPVRTPRGSRADNAALARFVAARNDAGGSTVRAKKKLERDLKGSNHESLKESIQQAIQIAERDIVVERRRKVGEWRANFMAAHRLTWPYYVWIEPDKTVAKVAGQRALEYMEFQWAIIRLLIGLSLPTLVLLFTNLTGHWCKSKGKEMAQNEQEWGIPLLDGTGDHSGTDYGK